MREASAESLDCGISFTGEPASTSAGKLILFFFLKIFVNFPIKINTLLSIKNFINFSIKCQKILRIYHIIICIQRVDMQGSGVVGKG
ncbi:hypothetical protein ANAPH2_00408 [Anaplasma phagocytophilum]|nr:hypothetical protein ANAPH2_00408 [Anaplasma phagocytophilum]